MNDALPISEPSETSVANKDFNLTSETASQEECKKGDKKQVLNEKSNKIAPEQDEKKGDIQAKIEDTRTTSSITDIGNI